MEQNERIEQIRAYHKRAHGKAMPYWTYDDDTQAVGFLLEQLDEARRQLDEVRQEGETEWRSVEEGYPEDFGLSGSFWCYHFDGRISECFRGLSKFSEWTWDAEKVEDRSITHWQPQAKPLPPPRPSPASREGEQEGGEQQTTPVQCPKCGGEGGVLFEGVQVVCAPCQRANCGLQTGQKQGGEEV